MTEAVGYGAYYRQSGFTLIELMVTLIVLGILLTIAIPSFENLVVSSRLGSYSNSLAASVRLAHGEAIKRNSAVSLCVSADGTNCAAGDWEQGWIVLAGTTVVQRQQALPSGYKIAESGGNATLSFPPSGIGVPVSTFTACRQSPEAGTSERVISVSATGRTSIQKTSNGVCP